MGSMLISPMVAFGLVEKGVFRSNSPGPTDFAFLRTLNLRTVVYLSPERLIKPVLKQFEENGVRFVSPCSVPQPNLARRTIIHVFR